MNDVEDAIRNRAHELWVESGCGHGNAETHWLRAQREVLAASLGSIATVTVAKSAAATERQAPAKTSKKKRRAA